MTAPNKAPPFYSDAKFREVIPILTLAEYLKIEYLSKGVWFKMLSKRGNSYNCECCGVDNIGPTPVLEHVRGKKHRFALQAAEQLYHPTYTHPKKVNANAPPRTPILDAYNAAAGVSVVAKNTKAAAVATATPKGTKAAAPNKSNVQAQKPAGQQKAAGTQQKQQKQQPKPAAVKKPNTTNKVEPAQAAATPKTNIVPNPAAAKTKESAQPEKNQEITEKTTTDGAVKQEVTDKPEENKVAANGNVTKKEDSKVLEVVVLDDDDDVTVNEDPKPKIPEGQAISTISTATAKPQRPPRRSVNVPPQVQPKSEPEVKSVDTLPPGTEGNEGDTTITTNKKVINPAAVLAKTGDQSDENTPRYQQNRVIIPTVDRTKKKTPVQNKDEVEEATQPSFSTKNISAKTPSEIEGIIGVEYVVKILKVYNDPEPFYECCLCEVVMDGIGMQTHLLGYNHRYKYLEKHFPTCFNQYKEHIGNIQVMGIILDRIAKAVEAHHGRELPYECLSGEFRSNRHGVMTTVYSFRHASEYSGPSFTNVVDSKQVEEFYKKKNIYLPPRPDPKRRPTFDTRSGGAPVPKRSKVERPAGRSGGGGTRGGSRGSGGASGRRPYREEMENNTIDDAVHKQMVEEFLQNTRGRSRSPGGGRRRRHRTRSRSRSRSPHRSSRRRIPRRSVSPLREGDVWQAYRHLVDRSKVELDQMYRDYRKDPEKHPLYDEEWRKFWKHRKEQMAREGLDHRNYDFQPEWVRYFAVRIEELYDEAVEDIKISSRRRLILPMTNDELDDTRYHLKKVQEEEEPMVVLKSKPMPDYTEMSHKTSVVSVLRLLTALEDYLGSLGPRVVDLLSKALLVEKSHPGEINEIVLNLENCTILETAMEKLKGVLIAGLLEGPKVRAFNNVITETEKILRMAYKMRQRNPQPVPQPVPAPKHQLDYQQQKSSYLGSGSSFMQQQSHSMGGSNSGGSSGSGAAASLLSQIDKKELATKLAAALTAQGKTDFNPEQLQQLIAVYSLIDKKKRDSAAAADKQKMTLSDTLTALLNPSEKSGGGGGMSGSITQPSSGGRIGGNYSNNSNDRVGGPGPLSNSSITNFVSMLNRDNLSTGGSGNSGDTQMWQNLQNIQNSLRMQNSGGFGNNSMGSGGAGGVGGGSGGSGYMDNMSSSTNFSRGGGFGGGSVSGTGTGGGGGGFNLGQNSSMNFNRSGPSGGGGRISGDNDGFQGNFQSMTSNNSSFSRGEDDDMHGGGGGRGGRENMLGGRGGDNMLGGRGGDNMLGGRGGDNMLGGRGGGGGVRGLGGTFSSGNLGGNMGGGGGGMGGGAGRMGSGSGGMGGGGGNFSRGGEGGGMGGGNNSGFSRGGNDNFHGGGGRNNIGGTGSEGGGGGFGGNFSGSGLNNYPSAGGLGGNNNYQRGSGGMGGGMGGGGPMSGGSGPLGNNSAGMGTNSGAMGGGSNFGRGGGGSSNFGNSMNNGNNFNKNSGRNEGSGPAFGSNQRMSGNQSNQQPMGRNALGGLNNSQAGRGGSNWRNQ